MAVQVVERTNPFVTIMKMSEVAKVAVIGMISGVIAAVLYILFNTYILSANYCATIGVSTAGCAHKESYIGAFSLIIAGFISLFLLIRQRTYRPLLVILLASASLWGVLAIVAELAPWLMIVIFALLSAIAYTAFSWLVQIRNFFIALVAGIITVVIMRLLLAA